MEDWRRENGLPSERVVEIDDYESTRYESLSDSYDDLEELELNTRGDGYD